MPKWMRQRQRVDYATLLILAISATEIASAFSLDRPSELSPRTKNSVSTIERECDFGHEIQIALQAVRHACTATMNIQEQMDAAGSTITKQDESPVTVADFASQAIILQQLKKEFPNDIFLAEETSATLTPAATDLVRDATNIHDEDRLKECIDIGSSFHDAEQGDPRERLWCLDPIDGTKGFLRKAQYCLAICLLEDGVPMIGILACPNLPTINDSSKRGCIFLAQRGQGCYELRLEPNSNPPILLTGSSNPESICDVTKARFCVGVEQDLRTPMDGVKQWQSYFTAN